MPAICCPNGLMWLVIKGLKFESVQSFLTLLILAAQALSSLPWDPSGLEQMNKVCEQPET